MLRDTLFGRKSRGGKETTKREIDTKSIYKLAGERWKREEIQRVKIGKGRKRKTRIPEKHTEREANKKKRRENQSERNKKRRVGI